MKRIVGLPGDTIAIENGNLKVNHVPVGRPDRENGQWIEDNGGIVHQIS